MSTDEKEIGSGLPKGFQLCNTGVPVLNTERTGNLTQKIVLCQDCR